MRGSVFSFLLRRLRAQVFQVAPHLFEFAIRSKRNNPLGLARKIVGLSSGRSHLHIFLSEKGGRPLQPPTVRADHFGEFIDFLRTKSAAQQLPPQRYHSRNSGAVVTNPSHSIPDRRSPGEDQSVGPCEPRSG
jgi:hypothetical protein